MKTFRTELLMFIFLLCVNVPVFAQAKLNCGDVIDLYEQSLNDIHSLEYSFNSENKFNTEYHAIDNKVYMRGKLQNAKKPDCNDISYERLLKNKQITNIQVISTNTNKEFVIRSEKLKETDKRFSNFLEHHCLRGFLHGKALNIAYIPDLLRAYVQSAQIIQIKENSAIELKGEKNGIRVIA